MAILTIAGQIPDFLENCPFFLNGQNIAEDNVAPCCLYICMCTQRVFVEIFIHVCLKLYSAFCDLHSNSNPGTEVRNNSNMKELHGLLCMEDKFEAGLNYGK